jgi:hypothetical protein
VVHSGKPPSVLKVWYWYQPAYSAYSQSCMNTN